jgi:parvulin-like peptidyl-prolyl isomerase
MPCHHRAMRHVILAGMLATSAVYAAPVGSVVEIDRTIARVGDAVIWESDVASRVKAGADRAAVIDTIIDEELVLVEGRKAGVSTDRSEVLAALDEIKKQNNLDDAGLDKALADSGYTRARYLVELERQLTRLRTLNQLIAPKVLIDDAAVAAELAVRKLPDTSKEAVRTELRRAAIDKLTVEWIVGLRKRAYITRRP